MGAFRFVSWLTSYEGTRQARALTGNNYANKEAYNDPDFAKMTDPSFGTQNLGQSLFVQAMPTINVRPVTAYDVTLSETWAYVVEAVNSDSSLDAAKASALFAEEIRNKIPELR
jgi:multiple sugar transport system substrate-binding protein